MLRRPPISTLTATPFPCTTPVRSHYRLRRDSEIEVIDGRRRYGNGQLRPAGPLREPAQRGESVDFRVLNVGSGAAEAGFGEWPMRLVADPAPPLVAGRPGHDRQIAL